MVKQFGNDYIMVVGHNGFTGFTLVMKNIERVMLMAQSEGSVGMAFYTKLVNEGYSTKKDGKPVNPNWN